jgi:pyridoxal phosphate enzyme (YggS family)
MGIRQNLAAIRERVQAALDRSGRSGQEVIIVGASKLMPAERIQEAIDAGIRYIGENRVQEAHAKKPSVKGEAHWHMIGHLQTNKVKKAIELFEMIQSVDSVRLAREISKRSLVHNKDVDVLVEVNMSGETSKSGVAPDRALDVTGQIASMDGIRVRGLMTIGALSDDVEDTRTCFAKLAKLARQLEDQAIDSCTMDFLSMGMSGDFEVAIEEGSNMIRIGTLLFGPRGN